jgi:hypothetical protein
VTQRWLAASVAAAGAAALTILAAAPASAAVHPAAATPDWSVSAATSGCPDSVRVLTPNRSASYFAQHPDELLATHTGVHVSAQMHQQLSRMASHSKHFLTSVTCKARPGHTKKTPAPSSATQTASGNWSGYQSSTRNNFIGAVMAWNVPSVSTAANSSATSSIWPGIGTGDSPGDSLVQDGTEQDVSCVLSVCTHDYYPWFEVVPEENQEEISNLTVSPGDAIESYVQYEPDQGEAYFYIDDITTGYAVYDIQYTDGGQFTGTGSQGEWIVERTEEGSNLPPLANFGTVSIEVASGAQGTGWADPKLTYPAASANSPYEITMKSCDGGTKTLAKPSSLASDGTDFSVAFQQRGTTDAFATCRRHGRIDRGSRRLCARGARSAGRSSVDLRHDRAHRCDAAGRRATAPGLAGPEPAGRVRPAGADHRDP